MKRLFLISICLIFSAAAAAAQSENAADAQRAEVKKLENMIGQWKGAGWILQGSQRETFAGTEIVQRKIDGLALLVEGNFKNAEGRTIHETLAVLAFDPQAKGYRFRTYLAAGRSGEHDFKITADGYEWGFQTPAGTVRYFIKISAEAWHETGEFSRDGKNWMKFFEMKLDRVK